MTKDSKIICRVSGLLKEKLERESNLRGEAEAVIVREALNKYFSKTDLLEVQPRLDEPVKYSTSKRK
jgi:predicted DNA-binding protein